MISVQQQQIRFRCFSSLSVVAKYVRSMRNVAQELALRRCCIVSDAAATGGMCVIIPLPSRACADGARVDDSYPKCNRNQCCSLLCAKEEEEVLTEKN
jgi:hypothetical protein